MGRVRVHQHVNPLATFYRSLPIEPFELEKLFENPELPLILDIGSARGRFLLKMAEAEPEVNYLGLEIREPLVEEANMIAAERNLTNLRYEFCNATVALSKLLEKVPENILKSVAIQFPDPWFKKKHAKRRMVKNKLVSAVVEHLNPLGEIFVQTDVEFLALEMFQMFRKNGQLQEKEISENPFPVKTERELAVEEKGGMVYRRIFTKISG